MSFPDAQRSYLLTLGNLSPMLVRSATYYRAVTPGPKTFYAACGRRMEARFTINTTVNVVPLRPTRT